jgi:predicted MFS family arabinose efflux permease
MRMAPNGTTPATPSCDETPSPQPLASRLPNTFRALRHRNYRLYFFGQLISFLGSFVQSTALQWVVYEMTKESTWTALVTVAPALPAFFLGTLGGTLADRWPKRHLIFWTQAGFLLLALVLAALVASGQARPWHLLLIQVGNGFIMALDLPARLSFVMEMVGRDDLLNAVALNSLLFNVARAAGPAVGGVLLTALGASACFTINALSFVAVLVALAAMRLPARVEPAGRRGGLGAVPAAFVYLARRPSLALLLLLAGGLALFGWPFQALLPALAKKQLQVEEGGYSLLLSGVGAGALVAALVVATYGSLARRKMFIGAGVVLTVVALLGLALAWNLLLAAAACALLGGGLILFFATTQGVVQLGTEDHNRGSVMGVWSMILTGGVPLGSLLAGLAADRWDEPVVLAAMAAACAATALGVLALARGRTKG